MLLQKETIHAVAFEIREMPILLLSSSLSLLLSRPYIVTYYNQICGRVAFSNSANLYHLLHT